MRYLRLDLQVAFSYTHLPSTPKLTLEEFKRISDDIVIENLPAHLSRSARRMHSCFENAWQFRINFADPDSKFEDFESATIAETFGCAERTLAARICQQIFTASSDRVVGRPSISNVYYDVFRGKLIHMETLLNDMRRHLSEKTKIEKKERRESKVVFLMIEGLEKLPSAENIFSIFRELAHLFQVSKITAIVCMQGEACTTVKSAFEDHRMYLNLSLIDLCKDIKFKEWEEADAHGSSDED
ncbi:hypothetical protein BJ508DRAFT_322947 [Ascobolus immersus RN42]|uniref:Uncharacterized protein n=1 Tax=Ascobolus immersus RN42 TaxID=1160509 RepID=A0A3N4IKA2_ASCIM|nr:hypothetical protein BJ508DRAFT_322947 [Ascobolus immersus RN42]